MHTRGVRACLHAQVSSTEIYLVVNAGCREKDLAHIGAHLAKAKAQGMDVSMTVHDDRSLLALQVRATMHASKRGGGVERVGVLCNALRVRRHVLHAQASACRQAPW